MFRLSVIYLTMVAFCFFGCRRNKQFHDTPKAYLNHVTVEGQYYSKDSSALIERLTIIMRNHENPFSNKEYFDSTVLMIDTILYDKTKNKIAFFVVARNPVTRNPHSDSKSPFYYNAVCYLGKRISVDSSAFELKDLGPFTMVNFEKLNEVKMAIRESYFSELSTVLDENGNPVFEYNLDDKRFWESPKGWRRAFTDL